MCFKQQQLHASNIDNMANMLRMRLQKPRKPKQVSNFSFSWGFIAEAIAS